MHKFFFWNIQQRLWDLRDYSVTRETLGAICFIGHVKWRQITQLFSELLHSEPERQGELVTMKPKSFWNRIYTKLVCCVTSQKVRKKVFNWSEVHLYRSNFLQNPYLNLPFHDLFVFHMIIFNLSIMKNWRTFRHICWKYRCNFKNHFTPLCWLDG